jgi:thiol-disulfide isomerase/thioredoxin
MKHLILALLLLIPFSAASRELPKPQLIAVYFYADWCSNCKILSPIYDEARSKGGLDKKDILFVKLNLTDKTAIHQSVLLASALGIDDYVKSRGSATGYAALLNAHTQEELALFDSSSNSDNIIKTIEARLK